MLALRARGLGSAWTTMTCRRQPEWPNCSASTRLVHPGRHVPGRVHDRHRLQARPRAWIRRRRPLEPLVSAEPLSSAHEVPTVHCEGVTDGERRVVRAEPQRGLRDLRRPAKATEQAEAIGDLLRLAAPTGDRRPEHRCVDCARTDGVDTDAVGRVVDRHAAGDADDAVLASGVGRLVRLRDGTSSSMRC